ncbi:MAG: heavy-metal-associated domain-containing protein [Planctomycetota bacterium]|nr:MAG: heavy-metal-associated domain-containing protein [Planctomycetota bacterium]
MHGVYAMASQRLIVAGMTCAGCVASLRHSLQPLCQVLEVDLEKGAVWIDRPVAADALVEALAASNFTLVDGGETAP